MPLSRHHEATIHIPALPEDVFAFADDHRNLSGHMTEKSLMMAGSSFTTEFDGDHGQAIGSHIRMAGQVLGVHVELDEVVTERDDPTHKAWETVGVPKLIVIGPYKMGFDVRPANGETALRVSIDYALPPRHAWIGRVFGKTYARWCVRQISRDVAEHFGSSS